MTHPHCLTISSLNFTGLLYMLIFCLTLPAYTQENRPLYDSLVNTLAQDLPEKKRMETLIQLGEMLKNHDAAKASQYGREALNLARELNDPKGKADAYYLVGAEYYTTARYDSCFILLDSALMHAQRINYQAGIANVYNAKAAIYEIIDKYESSLVLYEKSLIIRKELNDTLEIVISLGNLSILYGKMGNSALAGQKAREALIMKENGSTLSGLGDFYYDIGKLDSALFYHRRSLDFAEQEQNKRRMAIAKSAIARCLEMQGNYVEALDWYNRAINIFEAVNDRSNQSVIFRNMTLVYANMGNLNEAISSASKSLLIDLETGELSNASGSYNNIGYLHFMQEDYPLAKTYLDSALTLAQQTQNPDDFAMVYGSYTELFLALGDYDQVIAYHQKAIELYEKMNQSLDIAENLNYISQYYLVLKQYKDALKTSTRALNIAQELGARRLAQDAAKYQAEAYAGLGKGMEAYQAYVYHKTMADSLVNAEKTREFTQLEAEYEFKQEKDSIALAQEKETLALNATIAQGKSRQQTTLMGLTAVGLLLIILSAFYFKNQKKNRLLAKLNSDVQVQNTEIKAQRDHLDDLNKTKSKFFSIISHDLRSPMSSFQALSDVIDFNLKEENYEELREVNQEVVKRSKEITMLLDNLLSWAVQEEGQLPYNPESVSLHESVQEVINIYIPVAKYKNITLQNQMSLQDYVWADSNSFKTIIRNLVSNAIKFTNEGGEITIEAIALENQLSISVKDNGIGISVDKYQKLFETTENKSTTGTSGEKGVGLGLQLVRDFVKMNNGKVEVISELGKGTMFTVLLPRYADKLIIV